MAYQTVLMIKKGVGTSVIHLKNYSERNNLPIDTNKIFIIVYNLFGTRRKSLNMRSDINNKKPFQDSAGIHYCDIFAAFKNNLWRV